MRRKLNFVMIMICEWLWVQTDRIHWEYIIFMYNDSKKVINVFVSQIFRNEKYIYILMLNII